MRYHLLSDTHEILKSRHAGSETAVDSITGQMDEFHKVTGTKSLEFANLIAEEQKKLQEVETEKAKLIFTNQDNTEQLLKKTSEHGIILMSIKSLWQKIAVKTDFWLPRTSESSGAGGAG